MEFIFFIFQCIYFMLPAYVANMSPVIFKNYFKGLAKPVDGGRQWNGKPIFGHHKTWRGLILGTLMAVIIAFIQFELSFFSFFQKLSLADYNQWILIGFLMGFGALFGDMIKSFFKRRLKRKPGQPWIPFDQTDFVIGALLFVSMVYLPSWQLALTAILISLVLHIATNHIAFFLKIRNEKW